MVNPNGSRTELEYQRGSVAMPMSSEWEVERRSNIGSFLEPFIFIFDRVNWRK